MARAQAPKTQPANPPVDSVTGIVHSRRLASGVPLGGLGAGTIQVMSDGLISGATCNNNWAYPTRDLPGCFAAVHVRTGSRTVNRVLALSSPYGLPTVHGLDFEGLYPVARSTYVDGALPVAVSSQAFSPLIPHDLPNSAFPAAAFVYRVTNTSSTDVEVSVALAWENTLGVGGTVATGPFDNRAGNTVSPVPDAEGFFGQKFARPAASGGTDEAKLQNNAAGEMTLMTAPRQPHALVTSAAWSATDKTPGWWTSFETDGDVRTAAGDNLPGERHPSGVLCVRIVVKPRETVDLPFAVSWYIPRLITLEGGDYGHYYQALWPDSYAVARALLTEWHSLLALTEEWQRRILFSNLPRWMARRLINSVAPITTHSILTKDQTFLMLDDIGAPRFGIDRSEPGATKTPAMPADFGLGARQTRPGARLTSLSHRLAVSGLITDLFPVLSARELRLFMARQTAEGGLPESLGDIDRMIGLPQAGSIGASEEALVISPGPQGPLHSQQSLNNTSAFLIQVAQYVFRTGDREFLRSSVSNVHRALALFVDNRDADGLPSVASGTLPPASASLYLAALQAGARLCRLSASMAFHDVQVRPGLSGALDVLERSSRQDADEAIAKRCDEMLQRASAAIDGRYWNGHFYAERATTAPDICSMDQMIGIAFSDMLCGNGPAESDPMDLLPAAKIDQALASLQRLNDAKAPGRLAPVARVYQNGTAVPAPQSNECNLSAAILGDAVLAITRRKPEIGVALLRCLDEARNNVLYSPWQSPGRFAADTGEVAPFEGSSIAQAEDWNALAPMEGFAIDLTSGQLSLSPQIPGNWRSLSAPVFAPTFWGSMEYHPTARGGVTSLRIDRLIALPAATPTKRFGPSAGLVINRIRVPGPPPRPASAPAIAPPVAHVSRGTTPLGVRSTRDRYGDFILEFETPVKLSAGDRLEIDVH